METLEAVGMADEEKNGEMNREGTGVPAVTYCRMYNILIVLSVAAMKLYYSRADSDALRWILAPTAGWVRILSGIPFTYEPKIGYVNHGIRFIIAPSCSGVQFMTILFAAVALSFVHRMRRPWEKALWMAGSAAASVLLTVFVNGIRIALSIFLPKMVFGAGRTTGMEALNGWLTPERLHTITGVAVYFSALLVIWRVAGYIADRIADCVADRIDGCMPDSVDGREEKKLFREEMDGVRENGVQERRWKASGWIWPVSVYFLAVLVIPFFRGALRKDPGQFAEFALLVAGASAVILGLVRGTCCICRKLR